MRPAVRAPRSETRVRPRAVAVLGAECTGKSTLCEALGAALPAIVVPEQLRLWCAAQGRTPEAHEQADLAQAQHRAERAALARAQRDSLQWVICDTSPLMTALYSIEYFNDDALLGAALAHQRRYALTLVCATDLPWQSDGFLRDGPMRRANFHERLVEQLLRSQLSFHLLTGPPSGRLSSARALLGYT